MNYDSVKITAALKRAKLLTSGSYDLTLTKLAHWLHNDVNSRLKHWQQDAGFQKTPILLPQGSPLYEWVRLKDLLVNRGASTEDIVNTVSSYKALHKWATTPINWVEVVNVNDIAEQFMFVDANEFMSVQCLFGENVKHVVNESLFTDYVNTLEYLADAVDTRWKLTTVVYSLSHIQQRILTTNTAKREVA
jgi:phage gpG-like protein